jgi:hypothetical protein
MQGNSRWTLLVLSLAFFVSVPAIGAFDPPTAQPPDRLEKKPQPGPAKPPEESKQGKAPAQKKAEDKAIEVSEPAEDPAKLREIITKDMQSAEQKLQANDPGRETRQAQDRALHNIDKLIELARNPPPPQSQPDSSPPMGGQPQGGSQSQPQGGMSRRERREQQRRQMEQQGRGGQQRPMPGDPSQTETGTGQTGSGRTPTGGRGRPESDGMADRFADVAKDIWGHLPETLRQEVDHYYRDQFMPRYRDLLQQYYSRLAERDRGRGRDQ